MVAGLLARVVDAVVSQPYLALGVVQTAVLLAASSLLVYPTVAYTQNVAYTEGIRLLALGLVLLTVGNVVGVFFPTRYLVLTTAITLGASVAATTGLWFFAREFVDTDRASFETVPEESAGGFEDAE